MDVGEDEKIISTTAKNGSDFESSNVAFIYSFPVNTITPKIKLHAILMICLFFFKYLCTALRNCKYHFNKGSIIKELILDFFFMYVY